MGILDNYKALDLTNEKGMFCAKLLADMGAQIIRIAKPGQEVPKVYTNTVNSCLTLDIENIIDREKLKRFAKDADFVMESFPPGYLDSLGMGYAELSRTNPRLIMTSITNYGQTGPYRNYKSSDLVASGMGGQAYVCGEPDKAPLKPFGPQAYLTACLLAANGILLALRQRDTTNRGQYIDISIHECLAATLDHVLVRYFAEGVVAERRGSLYWNDGFRIFPCQDGYILLSLSLHWETLVEWLNSEGLAEDLIDPRWLSETERQKNISHIIEVLEKWTLRHSVNELVESGQLMHFPWAKVSTIPDVVNNPQLIERGFFIQSLDPESGKAYQYPGSPLKPKTKS